jgi:hypothetical protein
MTEREHVEDAMPAGFSAESYPLPVPSLQHDFRLACRLSERIPIGPTAAGGGHRNWIGLEGGHFQATWGSGIVVPGGQDNQVVGTDLSTHVDTQYLLKTDDGAYITVHTEGWRTAGAGGQEALKKLFDPRAADTVSPGDYRFRLYINLETGDDRYKHLNASMWIGSGARLGRWVVYDAYRVL